MPLGSYRNPRKPEKTAKATCIRKVDIFAYCNYIFVKHLSCDDAFTFECAFRKLDINTSSEWKSVGSSHWDPLRF